MHVGGKLDSLGLSEAKMGGEREVSIGHFREVKLRVRW